jgi:hypothetical protein
MVDAITPKLGLTKPEVGASRNNWGDKINADMDIIDNLLPSGSYTAADVLAKLKTVDGAGSGLDADLLDGQEGVYYAKQSDMTAVQSVNTTQDSNLATINTDQTTQNTRLTNIEAKNTSQDTAINLRITDAPSDGNTYARSNAAWVVGGGSGGGGYNFEMTYNSGGEPPGGGQIRFDNPALPSVTKMWVSETTAPGNDAAMALAYIGKKGTKCFIQDKNDSTKWTEVKLTSDSTDKGTYKEWTIDVLGNGLALTSGQRVMCYFSSGGGASVIVSDAAPASPVPGTLWFESDSGNTFIFYDDGNTQQWVQVAGALPDNASPARTAQSYNRVVNGAMQISQELADTGVTATSLYFMDQWASSFTGPGVTMQRVSTASPRTPGGNSNVMRIAITTAKGSLAAGDIVQAWQPIEGLRVADLAWGTAQAKQIVLRFAVNSPITGTFAVAINNSALDRSWIGNYTVNAINTWETKTLVVPGDTTGTWLTASGVGLYLDFTFAAGSAHVGVEGWQAGKKYVTSSQTNLAAAVQSLWVGDVGLYLDPNNTGAAPEWTTPDFAAELASCMRYWHKINVVWSGAATSAASYVTLNTYLAVPRTAPALSGINAGNVAFPATVGTLSHQNSGVQESRLANATAQGLYASQITANARM